MKHYIADKGRDMNNTLPLLKENRLLVLTAIDCSDNPYLDESIFETVKEIIAWDYLFYHLIHHGTIGTFLRHVRRLNLDQYLNPKIQEEIQLNNTLFQFRNRRYYQEMFRIAKLFEQNHISLTFVKGAQLVIAGYMEQENRFMNDIDCLIPKGQIPAAREVLKKNGYHEPEKINNDLRYRFKSEMGFIHSEDQEISIDITAVLNKNRELLHCYPLKIADLNSKTTLKTKDGLVYNEIENEFHFTYCLYHHIALNYLYRLNWLNDLYLMFKNLDPKKAELYVSKYKLSKALDLFHSILANHFGLGRIKKTKRLHPRVHQLYLTEECRFAHLFTIERNEAVRLQLIEKSRDRILFLIKKLFEPPGALRLRYNISRKSSIIFVYWMHYRKLLSRILKTSGKNE
jgi:hypothetical protein